MDNKEIQKRVKEFVKNWTGKGNEKQDTQSYWNELLFALGAEEPTRRIKYEKPVRVKTGDKETQKYIDAYIPETRVLIEQKDKKISLTKPARQSDGAMLTPYEQGRRYGQNLGHSEFPRWIVTSNFEEVRVYDNDKPGDAPYIIKLNELQKDYTRLSFLLSAKNEHLEKEKELSLKASELIGKIYSELLNHNGNKEDILESLNILAVRLTFLLYAEDSGLLDEPLQFYNYMSKYRNNSEEFAMRLEELFEVLDQKEDERYRFLDLDLSKFPYINGALFRKDSSIIMPNFNKKVIDMLLDEASLGFDWSSISPTIFGAAFESTLNAETRHDGGMHYTSLENIHKVIDPLFLDSLKEELKELLQLNLNDRRNMRKLDDFHNKIGSLTFLDPACGSGNFLTETFLSLKQLENKIIEAKLKGQIGLLTFNEDLIKVTLDQFHGIEINDWAVSVAKTALWIAEHQALKETQRILRADIDFLPLSSYSGIVEGNALRIDWNEVLPNTECSYIIGNPPYIGHQWQNKTQKKDLDIVFYGQKNYKRLDYVSAWYVQSAIYMKNTCIKGCFVSTNSIVQGESVGILWKYLKQLGLEIIFAYQSFLWESETKNSAKVYCVIIGFTCNKKIREKRIYTNKNYLKAKNINGYLLNAPDIFIERKNKPISNAPIMHRGNDPVDGGFLLLSQKEYEDYILSEPKGKKYIRSYMMGREFLNSIRRYCFWLVDINPSEIKKLPILYNRVLNVKKFRENSTSKQTRNNQTPMLFMRRVQPKNSYIALPKVSSEKRRYIPISFLSSEVISGDMLFIIENSDLYTFGILSSNVHNAWMRTVGGRLKSDYRYAESIVYNNFVWPDATEQQKDKIRKTAKAILEARNLYPESSLADLYDENLMPLQLRKAHQANDRAVMEAYGFDWHNMTEEECLAELFKLYDQKVKELENK